jgi:aryl-alcohol dehydrogenase
VRSLGTCRIVGASPLGAKASFDINDVMLGGKVIRGIIEGDSTAALFIPQLIDLHNQGGVPFDKLVKFYCLDQINQATDDSEKRGTIKPVIRMN